MFGRLTQRIGTEYDQLAILNPDFTVNQTALAIQGLPYYAASQLLYKVSRTLYIGGLLTSSFVLLSTNESPAAITHFGLWYFPDFLDIVWYKRGQECDDPHYKKMKVRSSLPSPFTLSHSTWVGLPRNIKLVVFCNLSDLFRYRPRNNLRCQIRITLVGTHRLHLIRMALRTHHWSSLRSCRIQPLDREPYADVGWGDGTR